MTRPFDPLALRIGSAYRRGLAAYVEAGRLLAEHKASLGHGKWLPWLRANAEALGFKSDRTAQYLMKVARENPKMSSDLSTTVWGKTAQWRAPTPGSLTNPLLEPSYSWYTPADDMALVRRVLRTIDCDPASCAEANETVRARTFYTREQDGLTLPWRGRVFLNPPFQTQFMRPFVSKLIADAATQAKRSYCAAPRPNTIGFIRSSPTHPAFALTSGGCGTSRRAESRREVRASAARLRTSPAVPTIRTSSAGSSAKLGQSCGSNGPIRLRARDVNLTDLTSATICSIFTPSAAALAVPVLMVARLGKTVQRGGASKGNFRKRRSRF